MPSAAMLASMATEPWSKSEMGRESGARCRTQKIDAGKSAARGASAARTAARLPVEPPKTTISRELSVSTLATTVSFRITHRSLRLNPKQRCFQLRAGCSVTDCNSNARVGRRAAAGTRVARLPSYCLTPATSSSQGTSTSNDSRNERRLSNTGRTEGTMQATTSTNVSRRIASKGPGQILSHF